MFLQAGKILYFPRMRHLIPHRSQDWINFDFVSIIVLKVSVLNKYM